MQQVLKVTMTSTAAMSASHSRPKKRDVNGILVFDKPLGWTSNKALQKVKSLFGARKAGHTGSLDPLATGILTICFGQATKLSSYLLDADKLYVVTGKLGERTDTGDSDGAVTETSPVGKLTRCQAETVFAEFTGQIEQVPPMYSALKHKGRRLYELARSGVEVERQPRPVTIHELRLLSLAAAELSFVVRCSKGTYVRTLLEDIAEKLGTCGHVTGLRRTGAGPYGEDDMVTAGELKEQAANGLEALDEMLRPADSVLPDWPAVRLTTDLTYYLRQGQPVAVPGAPTGGWVRLYGDDAGFLGVGEITPDRRIAPRRLFV